MDIFEFLQAQGIVAERHSHPPVMTVEESLRLVPKLPGLKTKNLFLRDKKGRRHLLVTVPHDLPVDLDALGVALDAHKLGFASAERLLKHLEIRPGSVSLTGSRIWAIWASVSSFSSRTTSMMVFCSRNARLTTSAALA